MNCRKFALNSAAFLFALLLGAPYLLAQQPDPQDPNQQQQPLPPQGPESVPGQTNAPDQTKAAGRAFPSPLILYGNDEDQDTNTAIGGYGPDNSPLTGIQNATLGVPDPEHSYWVPGVQYGMTALSPQSGQPGASWFAENYFIGNFTLLDTWSRSQLAFNYSGGGFISTDTTQVPNGQFQSLSFAESYHGNRWMAQILDQFSYLPQSGFGFGGGTNLGVPGIGGALGGGIGSLGNAFVPSSSIYGQGPQITNAGGAQLTYSFTPRTSITLSAVYGIQHFPEAGYADSNTFSTGLGYNYQLTRNDTIGVVYHFSNYQFPGQPQAYDDHSFSAAYGRKITGRLALRVTAGPEYTVYRIPFGGVSHTLGASVSASVTYGFERGSISLSYGHGLSGGSGIFIGSEADQINFNANRKLTRHWAGFANVGYSNNRPLAGAQIVNGLNKYSSVFAGGGVNRPFGRDLNMGLGYTISFNNSDTLSGCTGIACNNDYHEQTITLSIQWHTRPFLIRSF
jgi:hypothetical protein